VSLSTGVPANWNLPLFWATVDGSQAGNLTQASPALLVGQYNATTGSIGAGGANIPVAVGSPAQGTAMFGAGSMLDRMVQAFFKVNVNQLLFALPTPDASAGVAATGAIVLAGSSFSPGVLTIYIAGQVVQITIASTDTPTTAGANLAAAINANTQLPVTAVATAGSVALTCNWKGLTGNDITIIPNYYGVANGEVLPGGLTVTITPMASGAANPTPTAGISAIQMQGFDYVALPYTDAATLAAWGTEYGFAAGGRWNYARQQYGFILGAYRNNYSAAISYGPTQNAPVISTIIIEPTSPNPVWEWAAEYCGLAALGFTDDPARPLQTLEFQGLLPAQLQNRFTQAQLNNLTNSGFAIQGVAPDGNPMILREQTQYQFNSYGQADTAFGLLTVLATLQELLRRMSSAITSKYPRVKLIPDGTKIGPGQAAVTPTDIKAELISEFLQAQYDGLVADLPDFQNNLIVQISDTNPNVLQVLWPPQLAGQLRQFEVLAQFRLLYPTVTAS
jgi:phage tail sheath gpL-like